MPIRTPLVAATVTAAFVGWMWFHPGGEAAARAVSDLGLLAAALVAGVACLRRGSARAAGRWGWLLTAVSCFLWAAGQATWTVAQLIFDRALPFPSLGDVAFLAAIGVGIGALLAFPSAPRALANRLRTLVDGLIVALAVLFIAWTTFLEAMVHTASAADPWERILTLAYPVADIARLAVALIVVAAARRTRSSQTLLAAGFAVLAVTDCIYSYLLNQSAYRTGDVLDAGWMLAFVLIMLAAGSADGAGRDGTHSVRTRMTGPYLPVVAGAAVLATGGWHGPGGVFEAWHGSGGVFEAWTAGAILVLVAARQILTHFENVSLARQLEAGVEEIRRREQQLNEAQSLAAVGSWEADLGTGAMTASDTLYRLAGHEPGGIDPDVSAFGTFVHPEDRDLYQAAFAQACRTGSPASLDYRIIRRDGSERWVQSRFEVITDSEGSPVRVRGTSQDITERRQGELALRQSDERLRSLVEASPLAIIEYDRDGVVRFWNAAAETIYGWVRADVEGGRPPFFTPEGAATFNELFQRVLAGEQVHVDRLRRRKDGQAVHVSVSMAPLRGPDGDVVGVSSAGLDITLQRRLEDDLRQAQKMELIGRLAGGISHDFNNILTVVMGQGEMLLAEVDPDGGVAVRVRAIQDAARRAAEFTDQLLTFSRRQVTMGEPADLNSVVAAMRPVLERMIGAHIELDLRLCAGELVVPADVSQLQQLVLNLVVNACEAMTQGGRVTITTATAGALSGPTTAVLRVADTGIGMDESTRAHVFEPFFTTKEEGEGTGLGLAAVYGIVRQHGGEVHVASLPDAGSVFTVSLPLIAAAGSGGEAPSAPEFGSRATGTVLLVEDEAAVRELAREVLELQGHVVLEAADGAEALRVADAHGGVIDVLLTDVVLPQIPGPELADRLVAARPGLRVIFMSGYPERHLASIEGRRGIFLAKPFRPADLAAGVAAEVTAAAGLPSGV